MDELEAVMIDIPIMCAGDKKKSQLNSEREREGESTGRPREESREDGEGSNIEP